MRPLLLPILLFTPGIVFADFDSEYAKALSHFRTHDFDAAVVQAEELLK
ncbi:MAG: hypothetical protein FJ088_12155, partial [Deltaproteobacteria bacterium]|nr:hypothetical protein [Deltaproteobacteria bacterium]